MDDKTIQENTMQPFDELERSKARLSLQRFARKQDASVKPEDKIDPNDAELVKTFLSMKMVGGAQKESPCDLMSVHHKQHGKFGKLHAHT